MRALIFFILVLCMCSRVRDVKAEAAVNVQDYQFPDIRIPPIQIPGIPDIQIPDIQIPPILQLPPLPPCGNGLSPPLCTPQQHPNRPHYPSSPEHKNCWERRVTDDYCSYDREAYESRGIKRYFCCTTVTYSGVDCSTPTPTPFNKVLNHTCTDDHGAPVAKRNPLPSPPAAKPKPPPSPPAAKQTPPPSPPVAKQHPSSGGGGGGGDCRESYNYASGSGCSNRQCCEQTIETGIKCVNGVPKPYRNVINNSCYNQHP